MKWQIFSRLLMQHYANCLICINHLIDLLMLIVKETRRGIWLPQFHMGKTEQLQRSLGHLGRTSELKDIKNIKRGLANHLTRKPLKQIVKSCSTDGEIISQIIVVLPSIIADHSFWWSWYQCEIQRHHFFKIMKNYIFE